MSNSIKLHPEYGLAPALTFCNICGAESSELAMLGIKADEIMKQVQKATGEKEVGYKEYGINRIPSQEPCDSCKDILNGGGIIIIAHDTKESLRLPVEDFKHLEIIMIDENRGLDLRPYAGQIVQMKKAFWYHDKEGIKMRDPKEWADQ
jgi:hypothetical protein